MPHPSVLEAKPLAFLVSALLLAWTTAASAALPAEPVVPAGEYNVTVGVAGNNMTTLVCYREADVATLPALLLTLEDRLLRKDCKVEILEPGERSAKWLTSCKAQFANGTTAGTISWDAASFKGQARRTLGNIEMEFPFEAVRLSACE